MSFIAGSFGCFDDAPQTKGYPSTFPLASEDREGRRRKRINGCSGSGFVAVHLGKNGREQERRADAV
jgi:hypothetical protein